MGDELRLQFLCAASQVSNGSWMLLLDKHTLDLTCGFCESGLSLAKLPHTAAYDLGATGILVGSQCIGCFWRTVQAMEKVPGCGASISFLGCVSMVL